MWNVYLLYDEISEDSSNILVFSHLCWNVYRSYCHSVDICGPTCKPKEHESLLMSKNMFPNKSSQGSSRKLSNTCSQDSGVEFH